MFRRVTSRRNALRARQRRGTASARPMKNGVGIGASRTPNGQQDHWLPGFNFNVEEWFEGDRYETLAVCRSLEPARACGA
jgi:hypothetical protein